MPFGHWTGEILRFGLCVRFSLSVPDDCLLRKLKVNKNILSEKFGVLMNVELNRHTFTLVCFAYYLINLLYAGTYVEQCFRIKFFSIL